MQSINNYLLHFYIINYKNVKGKLNANKITLSMKEN